MVRILGIALALYAALALQPFLNEFAAAPIGVSLPVLVASLAMFVCGPSEAVLWAGAAGLVSDSHHAPPFGVDMFCLPLLAFLVRRMAGGRLPPTFPHATVATGALTFCVVLASATVRGLWTHAPLAAAPLLSLATRLTFGNMLAAAIVVVLLKLVPRRSATAMR